MSALTSTGGAPAPQERKLAAALYRISDDRQDSLPTQRAWAQRVTQRDGLTLAGEFEDGGISGAAVNRPGLDALAGFVRGRFYARDPVRYLVVLDLDRFSRRDSLSTSAWLDQLRTHGLRYIVTTAQRFDLHNPLDRTLIALGSDFTREPELRAKSNHVLNGMAERARRGLWMGGAPPYGYRLGPAADGEGAVLVKGPDEETETVRWVFATYATGRLTSYGIARALNARGVKPQRGGAGGWSRNTVLDMLANRAYLGCVVWGGRHPGRYHRLDKGMVVPREDKQDREQTQLLRGLKNLPVGPAAGGDCIVRRDAHPALIDRETFDACQRQRERNRHNRSAPRAETGNVWPLAGQMRCGHCGAPLWTIPVGEEGGKRKGTPVDRARVCCRERRRHAPACARSASAPYTQVLGRVIALLQEKLASPGAVAEMARELERQLAEEAKKGATGRGQRQRLEARVAELDGQIATGTRNLLQFPEDLRADAFESLRALKAERDAAGQQLRDLEAAERDAQASALEPEDLNATLAMVASLSPSWATRQEGELLRATLRDLVAEVRVHFRPRRPGDPKPPCGTVPARVVGRVEVDLTRNLADLLPTATRGRQVITVAVDL